MSKFEVYQIPRDFLDMARDAMFYDRNNGLWSKEQALEAYEANLDEGEEGYLLVATVEAETLEHVFTMTNNISQHQAHITQEAPMHSLSVGDIVVDMEEDDIYICAPFGFDLLIND